MKQTNTQVLFRREPRGFPVADEFEIVETAVPLPGPGQLLVGSLFLSLDPYMRMLMGGGWTFFGAVMAPGQVMVGRVLGKVHQQPSSRHRWKPSLSFARGLLGGHERSRPGGVATA